MPRGVWLFMLGVVAAVLGVSTARVAAGATTAGALTDTTATSTTSTSTTMTTSTTATTATTTTSTTETTATTTAPTFSPLAQSSLPAECVGAGVAAIVKPSRQVVALGTPATNAGPSAYPWSGSVLDFGSSTVGGSRCRSDEITLSAVSLLRGAVTATSVQATDGVGTTTGLAVEGVPVMANPRHTIPVGNWGVLTLGATVGRVTAPLVLRLRERHGSLPSGTVIAVAFSAIRAKTCASSQLGGQDAKSVAHKIRRRPPPDFPKTRYPFFLNGSLRDAAQESPVVAIAVRYLGVPYQWGGATPKSGFDCSGLVQYVFAQLGVPLVHYAAAQWAAPDAEPVAPDQLRPGDLVFFIGSDGTRTAPGHVGIYLGDGYFIDAPHTGAKVRIDSLTEPLFARQYLGARRIAGPFDDPLGLGKGEPYSSSATTPLGFGSPFAFGAGVGGASGGYPMSVGTAGLVRAVPRTWSFWLWAAAGLGGLLVLAATGGLVARRWQQLAALGPARRETPGRQKS